MSTYDTDQELSVMDVDSSTVALLNKSEIDMQVSTAHKYPRSIKRFRDEALQMVTLNENIADSCIYALPRGGKTIEGPSARFAEVIASSWGNCRAGARVVNDSGNFITAQGVFHDLERNVAITYEVQRRITDKNGVRFKDDMIGVTGNAASSIALRNAILKGIPKAFWDDMYQAARQTVMGDFQTLANRRAEAMKVFVSLGVTPEQVLFKLGVSGVEDITLEHLVLLRGLITAIRDGDTTPENAFAVEGEVSRVKPKTQAAKPKETPACTTEQFDKELPGWLKLIASGKKTAEQIISMTSTRFTLSEAQKAMLTEPPADNDEPTGPTYAEIARSIQAAKSVDDVNIAIDMIAEIANEKQRDELLDLCKAREIKLANGEG